MIRLLIANLTMILSVTAYAGTHDDFSKVPEQYDETLSAELQEWLNAYAEVYNRQDYDALLRMWDQDFSGVIYTAEEVDPPLHGWDRINRYFNPIPGFLVLDGIRNEYSDVRASYLAPDLAVATYRLRFDIKVKRQKPMSSWDRVLAVFRKKGDDWKLVAYAEAPMAPLTMVRKMLETAVPEDFDAYIESQQPVD